MSEAVAAIGSPYLDDPRRRLLWLAPLAVLLWVALLFGFSRLLEMTAPPPAELKPLEARIVELPPPAGLQAAPAHTIAPAAPKPKPQIVRKPAPARHEKVPPIPPALLPPSEAGTAKGEPAPAPPSSKANAAEGEPATGVTGLGSDSSGARAIYAPVPTIPDDLREDSLNAVAVAHFRVDYSGTVVVVLAQPTSNPRLNQILIDTLKQWRFFPAMRGGVAVDSEFDLRIPVTVQ